jgi:hypothetical protein
MKSEGAGPLGGPATVGNEETGTLSRESLGAGSAEIVAEETRTLSRAAAGFGSRWQNAESAIDEGLESNPGQGRSAGGGSIDR